MSAQFERYVERMTGCDDVECPNEDCVEYGEPIRVGHSCEGCGWSTADAFNAAFEAADATWKAKRQAGGEIWEIDE